MKQSVHGQKITFFFERALSLVRLTTGGLNRENDVAQQTSSMLWRFFLGEGKHIRRAIGFSVPPIEPLNLSVRHKGQGNFRVLQADVTKSTQERASESPSKIFPAGLIQNDHAVQRLLSSGCPRFVVSADDLLNERMADDVPV